MVVEAGVVNESDCSGTWKRQVCGCDEDIKAKRTVLIAIKVMKCHFFPNFQTAPQANQNMLFTT